MPTNVASDCILGRFVPRCVGGLRYGPSIVGVSSCCLSAPAGGCSCRVTLGTSLAALRFAETSPGASGLAPPSLSARLRSSTAAYRLLQAFFLALRVFPAGLVCVFGYLVVCFWICKRPPGALLDRVPPSAAWC